MRELEILIRLKQCSKVVNVIDSFAEGTIFYILIDHPRGTPLRNFVLAKTKPFLRELEVREILM